MTREIKFRAWDTLNKKYFENIYKAHENNLEILNIGLNGRLSLITVHQRIDESVFPNRFIVEQLTGTKDKDGLEVYEGDVLQPSNYEKVYYTVIWSDIHNGFKRQYKFIRKYEGSEWEEETLLPLYSDNHRVVGNIHQNSELVEV